MSEIHQNPVIYFEPDTHSLAFRALCSQEVFYDIRRQPRDSDKITFTEEDWVARAAFLAGWQDPITASPVACNINTVDHVREGLCRVMGRGTIPVPEVRDGYAWANELLPRQRDMHRIRAINLCLAEEAIAYQAVVGLLNDCITQAFQPETGSATFSLSALRPSGYRRHLQIA